MSTSPSSFGALLSSFTGGLEPSVGGLLFSECSRGGVAALCIVLATSRTFADPVMAVEVMAGALVIRALDEVAGPKHSPVLERQSDVEARSVLMSLEDAARDLGGDGNLATSELG